MKELEYKYTKEFTNIFKHIKPYEVLITEHNGIGTELSAEDIYYKTPEEDIYDIFDSRSILYVYDDYDCPKPLVKSKREKLFNNSEFLRNIIYQLDMELVKYPKNSDSNLYFCIVPIELDDIDSFKHMVKYEYVICKYFNNLFHRYNCDPNKKYDWMPLKNKPIAWKFISKI